MRQKCNPSSGEWTVFNWINPEVNVTTPDWPFTSLKRSLSKEQIAKL